MSGSGTYDEPVDARARAEAENQRRSKVMADSMRHFGNVPQGVTATSEEES